VDKEEFAEKIRARIEYEDELFNSRTTIFLGTNGLWAAAAGISNVLPLQIGIAVLGILVTIMWAMCSWQSWKVIKALTTKYLGLGGDKVERIVREALWGRRFSPTTILAKWLPMLFFCVWIVYSGWLVWLSL